MFFSSRQRKLSDGNGPARSRRHPKVRCRLRLEALEDRCLLSAGQLDPTFGTGGKVLTDFPSPETVISGNDFGREVAIQQADGKIVMAGPRQNPIGGIEVDLARYNTDGSLDGAFGDDGRVLDSFPGNFGVTGMALQADGKIVVAGYSYGSTGADFFVARYDTDGALDASFDVDGWLTTDLGSDDIATSVAVQADGKIVAAGYSNQVSTYNDFALARYNSDGSLDTGFDSDGLVTTNFGLSNDDGANSVAVQSDGKIVAAGQSDQGSTYYDFAVARYHSDGTLDTGFDGDGRVTTDFGLSNYDSAQSVAVQTDGKIVAAGYSYQGSTGYDFALARYDSSGALDAGFDTDGRVTTDFANSHDAANSVAVQSDGKIVAAGNSYQGGTGNDFALARFFTNGALDTGFDSDGMVTTDFGTDDVADSVAVQADGKIVAAGQSYQGSTGYDFALARYDTSGALDTGFDADGKVTTDFPSPVVIPGNDFGRQVAIQQADGKIVVAGNSANSIFGINEVGLARYDTDGSLDSTFGDDGRVRDSFPGFGEVTGLALQADGKIVVTGYSYGNGYDFFVARYNTDGTLDTSFDGDGWLTTDFGSDDFATSVAVQADGKIVVAGNSYQGSTYFDFALARYNSDGSLDTGFDSDGLVTTDFGLNDYDIANSVAVQSDGKIVAAGYSYQGSTYYDFALARYNSDGSLDTGFDGDGLVTTDFGSLSDSDLAFSVAVQSDGKIVAAGYSYGSTGYDFALARYNTDGTLDTGFDSDGLVTTDFANSDDVAFSVVVQADGKILAAGYSYQGSTGYDFALARYDTSGTLDTSFDSDGRVTTDFGSAEDYAYSVALQADGKIVAAGYSYQGSRFNDFALARYGNVAVEPDACDPTKTQLVVVGTAGDDNITIHPVGNTGAVEVRLNGTSLGTFSPTGRIVVLGHGGDDDIQVAGNISNSTWLYGGTGHDRLKGGAGNDVLVGGEGDDLLVAGSGRDLLIGGIGSDRLVGNADDDILIAGTTDHDANEAALCQIMDEWTRTDANIATRVSHLKGPLAGGSAGGNNGAFFLNDDTVHDDGNVDVLTGSSGQDWFFYNKDGDGNNAIKDKVTDLHGNEFQTDIDWIGGP